MIPHRVDGYYDRAGMAGSYMQSKNLIGIISGRAFVSVNHALDLFSNICHSIQDSVLHQGGGGHAHLHTLAISNHVDLLNGGKIVRQTEVDIIAIYKSLKQFDRFALQQRGSSRRNTVHVRQSKLHTFSAGNTRFLEQNSENGLGIF